MYGVFVLAYLIGFNVCFKQSHLAVLTVVGVVPYLIELLVVTRLFVGQYVVLVLECVEILLIVLNIDKMIGWLGLVACNIRCVKAQILRGFFLLEIAERAGHHLPVCPPKLR